MYKLGSIYCLFCVFFFWGGGIKQFEEYFWRWAKLPILLIFYFPPLDSATYDHSLPALPLDLHHIPLLHTGSHKIGLRKAHREPPNGRDLGSYL